MILGRPIGERWSVVRQDAARPDDCVIHGELEDRPDAGLIVTTNNIQGDILMKILREERTSVIGRSRSALIVEFNFWARNHASRNGTLCQELANKMNQIVGHHMDASLLLGLTRDMALRLLQPSGEFEENVDQCTLPKYSLGLIGRVKQSPHEISVLCIAATYIAEIRLLSLDGERKCVTSIDRDTALQMCGSIGYLRSNVLG
jgi:hypothetical protein